jgi:YfiH family protein
VALLWDEAESLPLLRWDGPAGVVGAFSTRIGGVSAGPYAALNLGLTTGDEPDRVGENRRRLCAAVGADPTRTVLNHQVHGHRVVVAEPLAGGFPAPIGPLEQADGLSTTQSELALVALAADCVPVLVARADGSALAVCHAGWRGLLAGVIERAVEALGPGDLRAAVGPCAGPEHYEVGPEVAVPLEERFGAAWGAGRVADLAGCAHAALRGAGIDEAHIDVAGICTIADPRRFFSHRRDGEPGGRQGAIAYLASR